MSIAIVASWLLAWGVVALVGARSVLLSA
jgi:hypothetical protein